MNQFSVKKMATNNLSLKLLGLVVAIILWLAIRGGQETTITQEVNIRYLMGASNTLVNEKSSVKKVSLRLKGPRPAMKSLALEDKFITIDLASAQPGQQRVKVRTKGLNLPRGVRVQEVDPPEITAIIDSNIKEPTGVSSEPGKD